MYVTLLNNCHIKKPHNQSLGRIVNDLEVQNQRSYERLRLIPMVSLWSRNDSLDDTDTILALPRSCDLKGFLCIVKCKSNTGVREDMSNAGLEADIYR